MIKQLKMGFKLMRYAHGMLGCVFAGVIFFLIGIVIDLNATQTAGTMKYVGSFFILITAMWPLQLLYSIDVSNEVAVSPWKKKLQTSVSALVGAASFLVTYLIVLGLSWYKYKSQMVTREEAVIELFLCAASILILLVYMGAALKYLVVSTILFFIAYYALMIWINVDVVLHPGRFQDVSLVVASVAGFVALGIGALLHYGITLLLYKKPISKYSQLSALRKKM